MDTEEAAIFLRFVNEDGTPNLGRLHQWVNTTGKRLGVEKHYRGKSILLNREQVEASLKPGAKRGGRS